MSQDTSPAGSDTNYSEAERWDPEGLRKRIFNNDDLFSALLNSFLNDSPKNSTTLLSAAKDLDLKTLKEVSHLLKGVCGQLCADKLHKICLAIEKVALTPTENIDTNYLNTLCTDFSKELSAIEALFQKALNPEENTENEESNDQLGDEDFISQIEALQSKLDQSEYIDPDTLSPLKTAYPGNPELQNLVIQLIEQINLFDNTAASATLKEITAMASQP